MILDWVVAPRFASSGTRAPGITAGTAIPSTIPPTRALVDPEALGLTFEALAFVTMRQEDRDTLLGFEAGVVAIPEVVSAQRLFGDPDYLLRILTRDLTAYQILEDDHLAALPGVQRITSTLVMKQIVNDRAIPL